MKSCPNWTKLARIVKNYEQGTWSEDELDPSGTVAVRAISNFLPLLSGFFELLNTISTGTGEKMSLTHQELWP